MALRTQADRSWIEQKYNSQWLANGCHPLSFLLTVGGPVERVIVHRGVEDSGVLVLEHESGVVSNLHLALGAPFSQPFERFSVYGGNASVEIDNSMSVRFQRGVPFNYAESTSFAPTGLDSGALVWEAQDSLNSLENRPEFIQGLYGGLRSFLDSVLAGSQREAASLEFARQISAVYEAAILSDGNTVDITQVSQCPLQFKMTPIAGMEYN